MLTYLRLQNFRSCIDTEWHLEPVTLLIGTNNAGKSNLCRALRFLSACLSEASVDDAARASGLAPSEVAHRNRPGEPIHIEVHWHTTIEASEALLRYELLLQQQAPSPIMQDILSVTDERLDRGDGEWTPGPRLGPGAADSGPAELRSLMRSLSYGPRWYDQAAHWRYYNLANCDLRSRQQAGYDAYLRDDGSNLPSCLFALKNEDSRRFDLLLKMVREVEPAIYTFNFIRPRPEELWLEVEDMSGGRYGLESLSDGTLNYLAMCYIALQGQLTTHRDTPRPRLIVLEEPENRLYVRHLRRLLEVIREGSKEQQTIITTHNPYLIDLFEDHLEEVRLVKRGQLGLEESTQVVTPDADVLRKRLQEFSLGELHFRELLQ